MSFSLFHHTIGLKKGGKRSAHNVKNDAFTFRTELEKQNPNIKGRSKLFTGFTPNKQTFPSQHVTFLKQPNNLQPYFSYFWFFC